MGGGTWSGDALGLLLDLDEELDSAEKRRLPGKAGGVCVRATVMPPASSFVAYARSTAYVRPVVRTTSISSGPIQRWTRQNLPPLL